MSGLLQRAAEFRKQIERRLRHEAPESTADQIGREKEEEVLAEMDAILESNRLAITKETLSYTAHSSGAILPLTINAGAFLLLVGLGALFIWMFDRNEESITSGERTVLTAEGRIIEAVRRAAAEDLSRKEAEIVSIEEELREAVASRATLMIGIEEEIARREESLREELSDELALERQRLRNEGLNDEAISASLAAFEAQKAQELEEELARVSAELEARGAEEEALLQERIEAYRLTLAESEAEQREIQSRLEDELDLARDRAETTAEAAAAGREALDALENLDRRRREEQLIQDQILAAYGEVDRAVGRAEYDTALNRLRTLEDYLSKASSASLPTVAERLEIETFIIDSLRELILARRSPPESAAADLRLATVTGLIEEGNSLYDQGEREAAKEQYIAALTTIPLLEQGYRQLQEIEEASRLTPEIVAAELSPEERRIVDSARRAESRRLALVASLRGLREEQRPASGDSGVFSREALIAVLNTKLLIRQALAADEVRREYPNLYKETEAVFEAYGEIQRREGYSTALEEIVSLTGYLAAGGSGNAFALATAEDERQGELLSRFLSNLEELLRVPNAE